MIGFREENGRFIEGFVIYLSIYLFYNYLLGILGYSRE